MAQHVVPARDLMDRTMVNLRAVDRLHRAGCNVYEVTQLVNSFLGALAHPWELWEEAFQAKAGREDRYADWPTVTKDNERDIDAAHPGEVIKLLRNAMAHGNIVFLADDEGEIEKVRLWNETPDGYRDWGTTITIEGLKEVLERFVAIARELPVPERIDPPHVKDRPKVERCLCCGQFPRAPRPQRWKVRID